MRKVPTSLIGAMVVVAAVANLWNWTVRSADVASSDGASAVAPVVVAVSPPAPPRKPRHRAVDSEAIARTAYVVESRRVDGRPAAGATVTLSPSLYDTGPGLVTKTADELGRAYFSAAEMDRVTHWEDSNDREDADDWEDLTDCEVVGDAGCVGTRSSCPFHVRVLLEAEFVVSERPNDRRREAAPDGAVTTILKLAPGVRVAGVVVDQDGAPVAGASCDLAWPGSMDGRSLAKSLNVSPHDDHVVTSGDGSFALVLPHDCDPQIQGVLRVSATGFDSHRRLLDVTGDGSDAIVVRIERRPTVRGRCVDDAGRPLFGVEVTSAMGDRVHSDHDGRFTLRGMHINDRRIALEIPDMATVGVSIPGDGRHDVDLPDIVIPRGVTLRAQVVDADGGTLAGSLVHIQPENGAPWSHVETLDANGRFVRDDLPRGTVRLTVRHPQCCAGAILSASHVPTGLAEEVRVELPRLPDAALRFVAETDQRPLRVETATITVWSVEDTSEKTHYDAFRYDVAGDRIVLMVPKAGAYRAQVEVPGFAPARVERFEVIAGGRAEVAVPLAEAR